LNFESLKISESDIKKHGHQSDFDIESVRLVMKLKNDPVDSQWAAQVTQHSIAKLSAKILGP
jgi:hypothetical protein